MPFVPFNFAPKRKRGISLLNALTYEIGFRQTVVGWFSVRFLDAPGEDKPRVVVSPEVFAQLLPSVDPRATAGRLEVDADTIRALGFEIAPEEVAV